MTSQIYARDGKSRIKAFEPVENRLTTLGKLLNTDTQVIVLYEKIAQVPEEERNPRLADSETMLR